MALVIDEKNKYRGFNVVKLTQQQPLKSDFSNIEGVKNISVSCVVKPHTESVRIKIAVFFVDDSLGSIAFTNKLFDVTSDDFTRLTYENITVPQGAKKARLVVLPITGVASVGLCKMEIGAVATDFSSNNQTHLTMITARGVYTGEIQAKQVLIGDGTLDNEWVKISENYIGLGNQVKQEFATLKADQLQFSKGMQEEFATLKADHLQFSKGVYQRVDEKAREIQQNLDGRIQGFQSTLDASGLKIVKIESGVEESMQRHQRQTDQAIASARSKNERDINSVREEANRKIQGFESKFKTVQTAITQIEAGKITLKNRDRKVKITTEDSADGAVILVGGDRISTATFSVDRRGKVRATDGEFQGDITASSINIGKTSKLEDDIHDTGAFLVNPGGGMASFMPVLLNAEVIGSLRIRPIEGTFEDGWNFSMTTGTLWAKRSNDTYYIQSNYPGCEYWWGVFNPDRHETFVEDYSKARYLVSGLDAEGKWQATSDIRLKENLLEITDNEAIEIIKALQIYQFNYKNNKDAQYIGVIAQDLVKVAPDKENVLWHEKDGYYTIPYQALGLVSQQAVKALITKVENLEKRLEALEKKIT